MDHCNESANWPTRIVAMIDSANTIVTVTSCTNIQLVCFQQVRYTINRSMQLVSLCVKMEQGYHGMCDMYIAYLQNSLSAV